MRPIEYGGKNERVGSLHFSEPITDFRTDDGQLTDRSSVIAQDYQQLNNQQLNNQQRN